MNRNGVITRRPNAGSCTAVCLIQPNDIEVQYAKKIQSILTCLLLASWSIGAAQAQDLEPRRWSHLPTGISVIGAGYGYTESDIFIDPVLRLEEFKSSLHAMGLSYVRSLDFFGKSARMDIVLPYATGRWEGILDGEFASVRRRGFADPRLRLSINLYGAPALKGKEFARYRAEHPTNTTIGAAIAVLAPLGEYTSERLINLGSNRWRLRPQLGILHQRNQWQFELTGSMFLYGKNKEFWQGTILEQDPLWFVQGHAIYSIKPGVWASVSAGYAYGGRSSVNGDPQFDERRQPYFAVSFGTALSPRQSIKIAFLHSETNRLIGSDFNTIVFGWSYLWFN